MTFIELNQIKKIFWQILKPAVCGSLKLLDIGYHNIGVLKVCPVCRCSADLSGFGIWLTAKDATFDIEHVQAGRIKIFLKLVGYWYAGSDNKRAGGFECKRGKGDTTRFPTTHGKNNSNFPFSFVGVSREINQLSICLALRRTEAAVIFNIGVAVLERISLHFVLSLCLE
jgi:hypothetical protein